MQNFYDLNKTTVHIGIAKDEYIEVPMLPIAAVPAFRQLKKDFLALQYVKDLAIAEEKSFEIRQRLAELCCQVLPEAMHDNVKHRLNLLRLMGLATVLIEGEDNAEEDENKKKVTL